MGVRDVIGICDLGLRGVMGTTGIKWDMSRFGSKRDCG